MIIQIIFKYKKKKKKNLQKTKTSPEKVKHIVSTKISAKYPQDNITEARLCKIRSMIKVLNHKQQGRPGCV